MKLDVLQARSLLDSRLEHVEELLLKNKMPPIDSAVASLTGVLFTSKTQAYREALLGCTLAKIIDPTVNVKRPYVGHGTDAFNGRTLDEEIVNPFLKDNKIPSSAGPYLSVFRRSVPFEESTRAGLRDKEGYDAFLALLDRLSSLRTEDDRRRFLAHLVCQFALLREASAVAISRLQRMSLPQYDRLITEILSTPSGGRFPVFVIVSTLEALREFFSLPWSIEYQGINVSDAASGTGGDVSVKVNGKPLFAAEVTERPLDKDRVVSTFNRKILPNSIVDYIFFTSVAVDATSDIPAVANAYFAQGHEITFFTIQEWVILMLGTIGGPGRLRFNQEMYKFLESDIPRQLKVAWNRAIENLAEVPRPRPS